MSHVDEWFHDQLIRLQAAQPPSTLASRAAARAILQADKAVRAVWLRRREMVVASVSLLAIMGLLAAEAIRGPVRADQPFGLSAPQAVFRAGAVPSINGHAPIAPMQDHNTVTMPGAGSRR